MLQFSLAASVRLRLTTVRAASTALTVSISTALKYILDIVDTTIRQHIFAVTVVTRRITATLGIFT